MPTDFLGFEPYEQQLDKWLPKARIVEQPAGPADAILHWRGEHGAITYWIEYKAHLEHQDVVAVAKQLDRYRLQFDPNRPTRLLVLANHIRRQQGQVLEQHDIDYIDLAGNAHLVTPRGFVHVEGIRPHEKKPVRRHATRGWVKTVMTLLIAPDLINEPYRPIAAAAGVVPATVMHCLAGLRGDGFIREVRRRRYLANPRELVALWVQGYGDLLRPKLTERRFQMKIGDKPERWERLTEVLQTHEIDWALTGGDAARLIDPHLRDDVTELYAAPQRFDTPELLRELQLQPAIEGNVRVIEPPGPIVFRRDPNRGPFPVAPALLAYAELRYRNNDQANEAAELLLPGVLANVEP